MTDSPAIPGLPDRAQYRSRQVQLTVDDVSIGLDRLHAVVREYLVSWAPQMVNDDHVFVCTLRLPVGGSPRLERELDLDFGELDELSYAVFLEFRPDTDYWAVFLRCAEDTTAWADAELRSTVSYVNKLHAIALQLSTEEATDVGMD